MNSIALVSPLGTKSKLLAAGAALAILTLAGCGPAPSEPVSPPTADLPDPLSASTPVPQPSGTPAAKVVFVVTAFQAQSKVGTHDFPVGALVTVLSEEGDDYTIAYKGVAVRNAKSFFSDNPPKTVTEATPPPTSAEPSLPGEPPLEPTASSVPSMTEQEQKTSEMIEEIRTLNEEIRVEGDKREATSSEDQKAGSSSQIEKLKKRRDKLSEDLTKTAKP